MRHAMCAFPLVGLVCAAAYVFWTVLCGAWPVPGWLQAGGILPDSRVHHGRHSSGRVCGYLRRAGQLCGTGKKAGNSQRPPLRFLCPDRVCSYFVAYFALCASVQMDRQALICLGLGFVLERTLSGWAVASFPIARNTGLVHTFATAADRVTVRRVLAVLAVCLCAGLMQPAAWPGSV